MGNANVNSALKISVALTTYNGAKYIEEQLDSIFAQTHLPDEIVVCDDCSTDSTVEKLFAYQQKYPDVIHIHRNPQNLGFIRNFEKAVSLCSRDIIVFCDQDDVWFPHKLERMLAVFEQDPTCGYVFSDAEVTDEFLQPKGYNIYSRYIKPDFRPGKTLPSIIHHMYVIGCTSAFRAKYRPYVLPFSNIWGHDHWTSFIVTVLSSLHMIDEPLMRYRRHASNVGNPVVWNNDVGGKLKQKYTGMFTKTYEHDCRIWGDMLEHLLALRNVEKPLFSPSALEEGIAAVKARYDFAKNRLAIKGRSRLTRLPLALRLYRNGEYTKYMRGPRTLIKDLIA